MDDRRKAIRLQAARERQLAALPQMHGVSEEAVEELKTIRQSGNLRGSYEVFEEEKKAEIYEEAARHNTSEASESSSGSSKKGRPNKSDSSQGAQAGSGGS